MTLPIDLLQANGVWMLPVTALICALGTALSGILLSIALRREGADRWARLGIAVLLQGAVIWMTYKIAGQPFRSGNDAGQAAAMLTPGDFALYAAMAMLGVVLLMVLHDRFQSRRSAKRTTEAGLNDALTGLPSRVALSEWMAPLEAKLRGSSDMSVLVVSMDLVGLDDLNRRHGQAIGDRLLAEVGRRLGAGCAAGEIVARVGGDEFMFIRGGRLTETLRATVLDRLRALVCSPIGIDGLTFQLGVSLGCADSLDGARTVELLMRRADLALAHAQSDAKGGAVAFDPLFETAQQTRQDLVADLRNALADDALELEYQRQNDANSRKLIGFEALLRWNHPDHGRISPGVFIQLAEETGLIVPIGDWVLRSACEEAVRWARPVGIAVNVAPQQFSDPGFARRVERVLADTGLRPGRLELEVTEASVISDRRSVARTIQDLHDLGVQIAMDDFGTGYSSLSILQALPFTKIKLDRTFITDVHLSTERTAVLRSTVLLGDALNIPVLAEGVEEEDELTFLAAEGCASVQGFFFGKPMPSAEIARALEGQGHGSDLQEAS